MNILTRITDRKILCVYSCLLNNKNRGPGLYSSLSDADNRKYLSGLSLTQNGREVYFFYLVMEKKIVDVLAEKKVTLSWLVNSKMVKPELFDHPHLVYHFTTPLKRCQSFDSQILILLNVLKPEPIEVVGH